jgi:uncharacterized protein
MFLPGLLGGVAFLYASVGHAGASGYIAVLTLVGQPPASIRPAALALNILVATIGTIQFARAGHVPWRQLPGFILLSIPAAYLGGSLLIQEKWLKPLLGLCLLIAALRMFQTARTHERPLSPPSLPLAALTGGAIGFLSGLTGTGGGIFLSPICLLLGWFNAKATAGLSVAFILVNSIAGLIAQIRTEAPFPADLPLWLLAAGLGGLAGSHLGSRRLTSPYLKRLLAAVLIIAAGKLLGLG